MDTDLTPTSTKSPDDTEIDTPPHTTRLLPALKNHLHLRHDDEHAAVTYKECMKNHAAAIGGHAVDGCGEFMPSPSSSATDPTSLTCAACRCHRNFHRQDPITPPFLDFRHPPFPKRFSVSPSPSPPPPAPHAFFGLSSGAGAEDHHQAPVTPTVENPVGRKRFRTKFSQDQKEKMHSFSVKLGWKMQKRDEAAVKEFCHEIGVSKGVLQVWMHNNKNTFGRKEIICAGAAIANGTNGADRNNFQTENGNGVHLHGSSSSSPA